MVLAFCQQAEISDGGHQLSQIRSLVATVSGLSADDSVHAVLRELESRIAEMTSLSDAIGHQLQSMTAAYRHLDQVMLSRKL